MHIEEEMISQSIDVQGFDRDSELSSGSYRDQTDTS